MPTRDDWIYLAGIIDGEGSLYLHRTNKNQEWKNCPRLQITNTDYRLVSWLKETFDGLLLSHEFKHTKHLKPCYYWQLVGPRLVPLLKEVLPFLKLKGEQAKTLLEIRAKTKGPGCRYTEKEKEFFRQMEKVLKELNGRGVCDGRDE